MRTLVLYHPKSDHVGLVEDYVHDYERFKGHKLELVSLETTEGADLARLYDVVQYPAVLAISNDGSIQKIWQSGVLPLMDELSYYTASEPEPINYLHHTVVPARA